MFVTLANSALFIVMETTLLPAIVGTCFTVASAKPLCFKAVRGIFRCCLKRAGVQNVIACFATDGIGNQNGWHVGLYDRTLDDNEKRIVAEGMEHFRKRLKIGGDVFFRFDVHNASSYLRGHEEVLEVVRIC